MGHGLARLGPVPMAEDQDGLIVLPGQLEGEPGSDPIGRAVHATPLDGLPGVKSGYLHHHLADDVAGWIPEGEFDFPSRPALALHLLGPPAGQALHGGQRRVHFRCGDLESDAMDDIRHIDLRSVQEPS